MNDDSNNDDVNSINRTSKSNNNNNNIIKQPHTRLTKTVPKRQECNHDTKSSINPTTTRVITQLNS